jgi:hypothetical protein
MIVNKRQETALEWLRRYSVATIPIIHGGKVPLVNWAKYQKELPNEADLMKWFAPMRNLAVVTGRGMVVLDFDDMDYYNLWKACFPDYNTFEVSTGRGFHVYFLVAEPVHTRKLYKIDVKADPGYVVSYPSLHHSGAQYKIVNNAGLEVVNSIDDILPAGLYSYRASNASPVTIKPAAARSKDPWQIANTVQSGANLIATIKRDFPILGMFPDAKPTSGGKYIARCPLHDDNNPSLWINPASGQCGCFAGCNNGRPMDIINLVANMENISNTEAIEKLRESLPN